jgi:hypothetical protein
VPNAITRRTIVSGQERISDRIIARLLLVLKSAHIAAGPRGVHKLGRVTNPRDLQGVRISAPHGVFVASK